MSEPVDTSASTMRRLLAQEDSSSTSTVAAVAMPISATVAVLIVVGLDGAVRGIRRRGRSE
jgi:hypothetical protein